MKSFHILLKYIRPYRKRLTIAFIGMVLFTLIGLLPPLITRFMIDSVATARAWHLLPWVIAAIIATPILAQVIQLMNIQLIMLSSSRVIADIRIAMFRKLMRASLAFHGEHASGMLVGRVMGDVSAIQQMLTGETIRIILDIVIVIFAVCVMVTISVPLTMVVFLMLALYLAAYHIFAKRIRRATQSYRNIFDQVGGRLQETITGVRQVRIFNREDWENTLFVERTEEGLERALAGNIAQLNLTTLCQSISGFGSTIIFGTGVFLILRLDKVMTYGELVAFNTYLWMLITPAVRLTNIAGQFAETSVSIERVAEILNADSRIPEPVPALDMPRGGGAVSFKNVTFSYKPDQPLYNKLSLEIPQRTTVALVGETGCGKTTFTSLLMRYWDIEEGEISINGTDISKVGLKDLRSLFGVVLQNPVIFDGTLAENIAYGKPWASREEIEAVAQSAEVTPIATNLSDGFDTRIGTIGAKLSMGEKQRLSIARAMLRDPEILVMDEATSSLDSHSEMLIQKALSRVLKGRTSFIIAHRLSTITSSDMIVVMDKGNIIEKGSHEDLLKLNGAYRSLYDHLSSEPDPPLKED